VPRANVHSYRSFGLRYSDRFCRPTNTRKQAVTCAATRRG
jgi:hypothetical protein